MGTLLGAKLSASLASRITAFDLRAAVTSVLGMVPEGGSGSWFSVTLSITCSFFSWELLSGLKDASEVRRGSADCEAHVEEKADQVGQPDMVAFDMLVY